MSQPYVGEIRLFAGNFAPVGWALCQGQTMSISENETLYNLIGTAFGGDGQSTFNLPNLASRVPVHQGSDGVSTYVLGQTGGVEQVTLTTNQVPSHTHAALCSSAAGTGGSPAGSVLAASTVSLYSDGGATDAMNSASVAPTGGSLPHANLPPYLALNFIISLFGVYPSPS